MSESIGWTEARRRALDRDGNACRFCGMTDDEHRDKHDRGLHVHHMLPESDGGEDHVENLLTVCCGCHKTLESATRRALDTVDDGGVPVQNLALARFHLREMANECRWLWHDELSQLSDLPAIEDRDLPGGYCPTDKKDVTDREKACYILGRIYAYSHAGTEIEASLERDWDKNTLDSRDEDLLDPVDAFSTPEDEPEPEFHNHVLW